MLCPRVVAGAKKEDRLRRALARRPRDLLGMDIELRIGHQLCAIRLIVEPEHLRTKACAVAKPATHAALYLYDDLVHDRSTFRAAQIDRHAQQHREGQVRHAIEAGLRQAHPGKALEDRSQQDIALKAGKLRPQTEVPSPAKAR